MKRIKMSKKKVLSLVSVVLVIGILLVGGTLALFNANTGSLNNVIEFGKVNIGVVLTGSETAYEDEPGNLVLTPQNISQESAVCIKNINLSDYPTVDTYVRARIVAILRDSDGKNGTGIQVENLSFSGTDGNWTKLGEYYYYKGALAPGDVTNVLIDGVLINGNPLPADGIVQGKLLEIQVLADGVIANPTAVKGAWGDEGFNVVKE